MNENIDLIKILKDCPKGWKFYSTLYGEVEFDKIKKESEYPIVIITKHGNNSDIKSDGRYYGEYDDGECTLFPSKDQRDWSKFSAPWYKKDRFDPKTLQPFDKVIVSNCDGDIWRCSIFSYIYMEKIIYLLCVMELVINTVFPTTMTPSILQAQWMTPLNTINIGNEKS